MGMAGGVVEPSTDLPSESEENWERVHTTLSRLSRARRSDAAAPSVAVVIPAYRVAKQIGEVIAKIPPVVRHIVVVDDASPDQLQEVLAGIHDPRLTVIRHTVNQGVGAATKTGIERALDLDVSIVVKIDGDGQMDPALIPQFLEPIVAGSADLTKGNRFADLQYVRDMPLIRRLGNLSLSFLVKMASGYWHVFDPCNGYIAIRSKLLRRMMLRRLADRYFFEISMLCEAYFVRAVLEDIPMRPVYDDEKSSLHSGAVVVEFTPKLIGRSLYRLFNSYLLRDFNVVTVFLGAGVPLFGFGTIWSLYHWIRSYQTGQFASTGTVMIGVLTLILGFQLIIQAIVLDVQNEPGRLRQ